MGRMDAITRILSGRGVIKSPHAGDWIETSNTPRANTIFQVPSRRGLDRNVNRIEVVAKKMDRGEDG